MVDLISLLTPYNCIYNITKLCLLYGRNSKIIFNLLAIITQKTQKQYLLTESREKLDIMLLFNQVQVFLKETKDFQLHFKPFQICKHAKYYLLIDFKIAVFIAFEVVSPSDSKGYCTSWNILYLLGLRWYINSTYYTYYKFLPYLIITQVTFAKEFTVCIT